VSVTAAEGFVAAGGHCGVKGDGRPDLALVATADRRPVPVAGVFTRNELTAAPVQVSRSHIAETGGEATAVLLNSGNANAATGAEGLERAERMAAVGGDALGCEPEHVLVCSTGLIGIPLPIEPIVGGQGGRGAVRPGRRRRDGQGRRHARAEHGDDAGRAHHRRRGFP
jgi:glutamate N-acetyltransferase/amino-acid N-acetyltransferase